MSWKLSVAEYVPPFIRGGTYRTTLASAIISANVTSINVADTNAQYSLLQNDILKLGPSTHADNLGAIDYVRIIDVEGAGQYDYLPLFLEGGTTSNAYKYSLGDPVEGVGHAVMDGWVHSATGDAFLQLMGIGSKEGSGGDLLGGYNNQLTGFWMKLATGTTGWHYITYNLRHKLLTETTYRLGVYVKQSGHNGNASALSLLDGDVPTIFININTQYNRADWTLSENTGALGANVYTEPYLLFRWGSTAAMAKGGFDCVYLTHAALTVDAASGVYTIPINPVTVSEVREGRGWVNGLINSGMKAYVNTLNHLPLRGYHIQFEDGTAAMLKQLEILQYWQNKGNLLMLESDITGDRPIFGFMDFHFSYRHWDDSRIFIDMIFRGI